MYITVKNVPTEAAVLCTSKCLTKVVQKVSHNYSIN